MSHVRQQIRDAVAVLCTGLTTTGTRVYKSRIYPLDDSNLPGLLIKTGPEEVDREAGRVAGIQERLLEIVVEGYDKLTSGLDDKLDTIAAEVETVILSAGITGASTVDLFEIEEPELVDGLEQPVGKIKLIFGVRYLTEDGAPTTAL